MKINDIQRIGAYRVYQPASEQRVGGTSGKRRKDEVKFSAEAMEMLSQTQNNSPDRAKHIQALKKAVSTGAYHVDSGKLAEKILPFII